MNAGGSRDRGHAGAQREDGSTRPLLLAIALVWLIPSPTPSAAADAAAAVYRYTVEHSLYGIIGRHRMALSEEGSRLVIEHENVIGIRLLFAPVYERQARSREIWQDDRLVRLDGTTIENGETVAVRVRAEGEGLVIEGPDGRHAAPAQTVPVQPSVERVLGVRWFMQVPTGRVLEGKVEPGVVEMVQVGGRTMPATRYRITGGVEQDVWFDEGGIWLKWQLERGGGTVTLIREAP